MKLEKHFLLIGSLFIWALLSACSQNDTPNLDYTFEVAKDVKENIDDFHKVEFERFDDLNLGFYQGTIWIKLEIWNDARQNSLMFSNNDLFNRNYRFYKLDTLNNTLILVNTTKDDKPIKDNRSYNDAYPNLRINLKSNEHTVYLITADCDGRTIDATPTVLSLEHYFSRTNQSFIWSIVFIGIIFFLLILNIYLWNIHGERIYLYYILYMLATLLMYTGFEGYLYKLDLNNLAVDHIIFISVRLWIFSLIIFTSKFLRTKQVAPKYYKFMIVFLLMILGGNTIYQLVFYSSSIAHLHYYENILSFLWFSILLITIVVSSQERKLELKYYLIPFSCFVLFIILGLVDGHLRIFPGSPFIYIKLGTVIEFIGFTYFMTVLIKSKINQGDNLQQELKFKSQELIATSKKLEELNALLASKSNIEKTDLINIFSLLENSLTDEGDWDFFKEKFKELNPNFLNDLLEKHHDLSKSEIRLLTLIRIGYSQKEIAHILNIAPDSVKKSRSRVRKKLNLSESIHLSDYLENF